MKGLAALIVIFFSFSMLFSETTFKTNVEQYKIRDEGENLKEVEKYLKSRQQEMEKEKKKRAPESSLQRFEIMFFSAGAISYLSSWLLATVYAAFAQPEASGLPDNYWMFVVVNSVGMATYISIKDYYDVKRFRENEEQSFIRQQHYKVSLLSINF